MAEKIIFYILTFVMLVTIFGKFSKRKDKIYIYVITLQFLALILKIIFDTNSIKISFFFGFILYVFAIIIPLIICYLEQKKIYLTEAVSIFKAQMAIKYKQNDRARRILLKLIHKYPDSYYGHKLLAEVYEKSGRAEDAIDEFVRAVDINSKDYDSYYQIAFLLNQLQKQNEAAEMLQDLISKKPEYYKASELLGTIYYDQERFKEAESVYLNALNYNPMRFELYYGLGMVYTRLNDFQQAKEYYEKAAAINSMLFHAEFNLAQIALITGELDEAEHRLLQCLQDDDCEPDAYYYLAIIYIAKGNEDRATEYINRAIELDSRIYKRVCKQEVFAAILIDVIKQESRKHVYHLTKQEFLTRKYLDDTYNLIEKMKKNGNFSGSGTLYKKPNEEHDKLDRKKVDREH